jgi:hypothetical protein
MFEKTACSSCSGSFLQRALRVSLFAAALYGAGCGLLGGARAATGADAPGADDVRIAAVFPSGGGLFADAETETAEPVEPPPAAQPRVSYVRVTDTVQLRFGLGAEIYDDSDLGVGPVFEMELRTRVAGPLYIGALSGFGGTDHSETDALARGTMYTFNLLVTVGAEFPLGGGQLAPMIHVGAGAGALIVDPLVADSVEDDLYYMDLELEEEPFALFNARVRADLTLVMDPLRTTTFSIGVVRDFAEGHVETVLRDYWTGATVSRSDELQSLSRTAIQVSFDVRF